MFCYEDLLNKTSTEKAPWFVVPADDKPTARLILANILIKELKLFTQLGCINISDYSTKKLLG